MDIIEVNKLSIQYAGGKKSVRDCSFSVQKGEIFGLLGSNGAGKSTILLVFAGLLKNFKGEVKILGQDCANRDVLGSIAYVPQSPCMFSDFTVRENIAFFCSMEGIDWEEKDKHIKDLLRLFSLEHFENTQVGRLSGGYRQLLNIALSSVLDKKIILMDEPTAGLDLSAKRKVTEYIRSLKAKGKTVILTTHDLVDAEDLCDNVVILSNGQVLAKGNIKTLLKEFGGAYTIRIKLGKKMNAIPKLSFSRVLKASENELVVEASDAGHAMRELINILENAGIAIENLEVREPSLRYVFSNLLSKVKQ